MDKVKVNKSELKNNYSIFRIIFTELKTSLTPGKIIGTVIGSLIIPIIINYLGLIIVGFDAGSPASFREALRFDNARLLLAGQGAVTIMMFSRITSTVRDKATVDKNKMAFLYYGKNKVTFSKLLVESIMFSINYFSLFAIAWIIGETRGAAIAESEFIGSIFAIFVGYLVLHLVIYTLGKWAISFIPKKGLAYGAALLITLIILTPIWILNQLQWTTTLSFDLNQGSGRVIDKNIKAIFGEFDSGAKTWKTVPDPNVNVFDGVRNSNWFNNNQKIVSFIPVINFGLFGGTSTSLGSNELKPYINKYYQLMSQLTTDGKTPAEYLGNASKVGMLDEQWYIVIPILYSAIGLTGIWNLQSAAQKNYLAAS